MGALPFLRPLHGQVDHIQLVEPAGFDPHVAVCIVRSHGHKIQRDSRRKAITVLVIGVVAAQLCAARCRINLHLPARPKVQLKLFQRSTVACPLPTDLLRRIAIQCPELIVPFAAAISFRSCALFAITIPPSICCFGIDGFVTSIVMHPTAFFNFQR